MKKSYKKVMTGVLTAGMICSMGMTAFAASDAEYTKNENVYVRLEQDGSVNGTYVVNSFKVTKAGEITDYGEYDKIQNLTDLEEIQSDKDEHVFQAEEGKFYYQGDLEKAELPWTFDITYTLDGEEVKGEELEGAEGDLELRIQIRKNPAFTDEAFWGAYLLQSTVTLDPELCKNIEAESISVPQEEGEEAVTNPASIADAGGDERITFTVNPGTETDLLIKAEVKDFEMDDISIVAAPVGGGAKSFVSADNNKISQTIFAVSAQGVTIQEPEVKEVVAEKTSFLDKVKSLFQ